MEKFFELPIPRIHGSRIRRGVCSAGLFLLLLTAIGCSEQHGQLPAATHFPDSMPANPVLQDSGEIEEAADTQVIPPLKAESERKVLHELREQALQSERKALISTRLEGWLKGAGPQAATQLTEEQFRQLTSEERLGHWLLYPEEGAGGDPHSYAGDVMGISRKLPEGIADYYASERQMNGIRKDSNAVKKLILDGLKTRQSVSVPMMQLIVELKLVKAIPALIDIYKAQPTKDDLILTTLVGLMEHTNFWKWTYSPIFKAMLVDPNESVPLTPANADTIISMAQKLALR